MSSTAVDDDEDDTTTISTSKGEEYQRLLTRAKGYLPFIKEVIEGGRNFRIQDEHLVKLRSLYEMVDEKSLHIDKLRSCQNIIDSLHDKYYAELSEEQLKNIENGKKLIQIKIGDSTTKFSEMTLTSKKSDQKQNSESDLFSEVPASSNIRNDILDKQLEGSPMPIRKGVPQFTDSRLRLNKVIGFATNFSIDKLNTSDKSATELAKELYDEVLQNPDQTVNPDILKGINMDDIDVNHIKKVIESINETNNIQLIPLPSTDLMDLGLTPVKSVSSAKAEVENKISILLEQQPNSALVPSKLPSIRQKLNNDINVLHKIGAPSEPKFISALKPGTLIDLEKSNISRSSLHIESHRQPAKLNEKKTDIKSSSVKLGTKVNETVTGLMVPMVPRDPRNRNKWVLNPVSMNADQLLPHYMCENAQQLIPAVQDSILLSTSEVSNSTLFEPKAQEMTPLLAPMNTFTNIISQQEMSVLNEPTSFRNQPVHTNIQSIHEQFPQEHNGNSNLLQSNNFRALNHSQHKHRNDLTVDNRNDSCQYSSSNQMHINQISHNDILRRNREPASYKSYNDPRWYPRSMNREQKINERQYRQGYRETKEYREAKYGKEKNSYKGSSQNKNYTNQNQEHDRSRTSIRDNEKLKNKSKTETKDINPYRDLGVINDSVSIKSFKIPKIKQKEVDSNIPVKELKTKKVTEDEMNTSITKDNNTKKDKNLSKDLKSEKMINNSIQFDSNEKNEDLKMVLENHTENCSSNTTNEVNSKTKENYTINEPCKSKKPKKYSEEKEFEKIVKNAAQRLVHDDTCGPRTRTRSSLKKNETIKNSNFKDSGKTYKEKKIILEECSKNVNTPSHHDSGDLNRSIETGQNVISSTSKEMSEVDRSTETTCQSHQENIVVSSNEINSTADTQRNSIADIQRNSVDEDLLTKLKNHPLLIDLLTNDEKLDKLVELSKLLGSTDIKNIDEDKTKNKSILNEDLNVNIKPKVSMKKKKKRGVKKKRKTKCRTESTESSSDESDLDQVNEISNTVILNQEKSSTVINKEAENSLDSLNNVGNENSLKNVDQLTTNKVKSKSNKHNKPKQKYEILKDKGKELKDLKIVIAKYDENDKRIENLGMSSNVQTTNKRKNDETIQNSKPKKPFLGPLSVKLARQKMEMEQNTSNNCDEKCSIQINANEKSSYTITNSLVNQLPYVVLNSIDDSLITSNTSTVPSEATLFKDKLAVTDQNASKITCTKTNIKVNRSGVKKPRPKMTELDKLHADINENCATVLSVPNVRQCRTNKQVDYVNTNIDISPKKNKTSNVEHLNLDNKCGVRKSNKSKKESKKSILKLNKNIQFVKKSNKKKTLTRKAVKNVVQSCKLNKLKSSKNTNEQLQLKTIEIDSLESCPESNLKSSSIIVPEKIPKGLSETEFKDKLCFQSVGNAMKCNFCDFYDHIINLVGHYKSKHNDEEVLISRISKEFAEVLINESCNENYAFINSNKLQNSKSLSCVSKDKCIKFNCVFCGMVFYNIDMFCDHITCHTGEYRYKCKVCEQIFPYERELKSHIFKHHVYYDKSDGLFILLLPDLIKNNKLFGYLCPFCYYIQLDYNKMVKHMTLRHFDEDTKCNGHWTIIRVNMSVEDKHSIDSIIDYNSLNGCLPPVQNEETALQTIPKEENPNGQLKETNIPELTVRSNSQLKVASASIEKDCCEQGMLEGISETSKLPLEDLSNTSKLSLEDISETSKLSLSPKQSNKVCLLKSRMLKLSTKRAHPPYMPKSNMHQLSPTPTDSPCISMPELNMLQLSSKPVDPSCVSESTLLQMSPNQEILPCTSKTNECLLSLQNEKPAQPTIPKDGNPNEQIKQTNISELTVDSNNQLKVALASIKKECFDQEMLEDISETSKLPLLSEQSNKPYLPKSHKLQLSPKQANFPCISMPESNMLQPSSKPVDPPCTPESILPQLSRKRENLPCLSKENGCFPPVQNENHAQQTIPKDVSIIEYTLKDEFTKCVVAGLSCELMNTVLLYKCSASKCLQNQYSTVIYTDFLNHVQLDHRLLVWDGKCETCNVKLEKVSEERFLMDALEHLIACHLVMKNIEQPKMSNVLDLGKKQSLSSTSEETVKEAEDKFKPLKLRIRRFSGDILSSYTSDTIDGWSNEALWLTKQKDLNVHEESNEQNMVRSTEKLVLSENIIDTTFENPGDETNTYQVTNIPNLPKINVPQIINVMSLNKKVNTPGIVIKGISLWTDVDTLHDIVYPDFFVDRSLFLQTVNNTISTTGPYTFIEVNYKKDSLKKERDFPMHLIKSRFAIKEMMSLPKLFGLYKCLERCCSKVFDNKDSFILHMKLHFSNAEKKKKNQIYNIEQFKKCAYCFKSFDDEVSLANHIDDSYTFCKYGCPYCFYRAYNPSHVLVHQSLIHSTFNLFVYNIEYSNENCPNRSEISKVINFNKFVHMYSCKVGSCNFRCYLESNFVFHLSREHQKCDKFCCYICAKENNSDGYFALQPKSLINHFKLHSINLYQCIFCLFGTENVDSMLKHLAMEHFEFEPFCLERSHMTPPNINYKDDDISNLKILRIQKVVEESIIESVTVSTNKFLRQIPPQKTKKRRSNCPDVLKTAIESAQIDEIPQPSNTIVITVPDRAQMTNTSSTLAENDNEFIFLDGDGNDTHPTVQINDNLSIAQSKNDRAQMTNSTSSILTEKGKELIYRDNENDTQLTLLVDNNLSVAKNKDNRAQMKCSTSSSLTENDNELIYLDDDENDTVPAVQVDNNLSVAKNKDNKAQRMCSSSSTLSKNDVELILIDDDDNDTHPTVQIDDNLSVAQNKDVEVIVIDDEDDDNDESNKVENISTKRKHSIAGSSGMSNRPKRLALPLIALDKLFTCKKCDKVYSSGVDYHFHLTQCPFWNSEGQQCVYCSKTFKIKQHMLEHIRLHGPDRFKCHFCHMKVPSIHAITHHIKTKHNIEKLDFVAENPSLTDFDKDEFIVQEKKKTIYFVCCKCPFKGRNQEEITSHMKDDHCMQPYEILVPQSLKIVDDFTREYKTKIIVTEGHKASKKRKRSVNYGNKKGSPKKANDDKAKCLLFSPDTIDNIPKRPIFSEPIGCSQCSYNTKVQKNLVIHLRAHQEGKNNTTKEIVNPVPSIGKSELMFDKMINLSASSFEAMNTAKIKIDELNKKIVEVAPREELNMELYPSFIPQNQRYKCSAHHCKYIGLCFDMLKKHISILHHADTCYECPYCTSLSSSILPKTVDLKHMEFHLMHHGENLYSCQYCTYIHFNRIEMKTHMRNVHLSKLTSSNQSNIIVIRQTMLNDDCCTEKIKPARCNIAQWICNICAKGIKYTENEITTHILEAHNVSNIFKCPMCEFEHCDDNHKIFEEHYKLKHPSIAVQCLKVFEKIDSLNELQKQSNQLADSTYALEQQALESIEPTIVPPTCRGIPIDSIPIDKTSNKSRSVPKSPKVPTKTPPNQARKQTVVTDTFSIDDSLGTISSKGQFTCPRCNEFETPNKKLFNEHLQKEVNYKTWKCLKCFEISDSPKKMAWHVKKHGAGSKYERIEDDDKLQWVERVLQHQNNLFDEYQKEMKERHVRGTTVQKNDVRDKKALCSPTKKKKNDKEVPGSIMINQTNDDVINLMDSDDE